MGRDRRGQTRPDNSYKHQSHDVREAALEKKYGLPAGGMKAIRTKGERSNGDQVSPVGAFSVYQIMPATAARFKKRYGVDANQGLDQAAEVAAIHLRDDLKRTGSWEGAVRGYIGGPDTRQHGPVTRAYVGRVTGKSQGKPLTRPAGDRGAVQLAEGIDLKTMPVENILSMAPNELGNTRRPLGPEIRERKPKVDKNAANVNALTGGKGLALGAEADLTPDTSVENREQARATIVQKGKDSIGFAERLEASWEGWLGTAMINAMTEATPDAEPGFAEYYLGRMDEIEAGASSTADVTALREATSRADLAIIQDRIMRQRENDEILDSNGTGTAFRLSAGLTDPVGWIAGAGVSKVANVAGVGGMVLAQQGRRGAAVASTALEAGAANVAFTGALDMAGVDQTALDYGISGLTGLAIGGAMSPLVLMGVPDQSASVLTAGLRKAEAMAEAETRAAATATVAARTDGAPTPEAVTAEMASIKMTQTQEHLSRSLAEVPDGMRLLSADPDMLLTSDPAVLADVTKRANLDAISDNAERAMVAEHVARAEAIERANPIDKAATRTSLSMVGMESTGIRLLASESPVARAAGITLLESTTGAAGRHRTASISQAVRETMYNRDMIQYDQLHTMFRKGEGGGIMQDAWDGRFRRQFNERVFDEVEWRQGKPDGVSNDPNPAVAKAADLFEGGMNKMRTEQQWVDAVGSSRLGTTSRGYMPHRLDGAKVLKLTPAQQKVVRDELKAQFIDPTNGFDEKFSARLAAQYLEKARERAKGGYDVPMNLHSSEAADIVRDSLEAMNIPKDELEKLMGKYSRGGAGHTKRRLSLNLAADIGDGMKLRDLFVTDVPGLYRGYARRVSGEVALAQYGIMGKKGLNVLRKAIQETNGSADDLKAFDQIAAEFLNTPFGDWNHNYMDNVRIATSTARLGGMGFTQFAEYGNGLAAVGVQRVMASIGALPRLVKEVTHLKKGGEAANPILASIDDMGGHLGLDDYNNTRLFDIKDNEIQMYGSERIGVGSRALRAAGNAQASISGHRMITAVQTRGMAEQIVRKAVKFAKTGGDDVALDDMGINAELRAALNRNMDKIATFDAKGNLLDLDIRKGDLTGPEQADLVAAIRRGASQIIQRTYTGETGKWAHNGFLKMLFQFRTFSLISVEKQWGRNRANYGAMKSAMYLFGAMSFALPIHMVRTQAKMTGMSRSEREKYAARNMNAAALGRATMNYASSAGLLGDIIDVGGGFASDFGLVSDDLGQQIGARGGGRGTVIGGVVAPGVGLIEDLWKGVHGDGKKLAKALPGANLPYVTPIITGLTTEGN